MNTQDTEEKKVICTDCGSEKVLCECMNDYGLGKLPPYIHSMKRLQDTPQPTDTEGWKKNIRDILEAPIRAKYSTADIRVAHLSSTGLNEKVTDIADLIKSQISLAYNRGLEKGALKGERNRLIEQIREEVGREITEDTSDGYHTFKELYEFRKTYNAVLFNEWAKQKMYSVHKSERHHNGEFCFGGGWFIVVATLPSGDISNHYEMKDWDLFNCDVREKSKEWDGHTSEDVLKRLINLKTNIK